MIIVITLLQKKVELLIWVYNNDKLVGILMIKLSYCLNFELAGSNTQQSASWESISEIFLLHFSMENAIIQVWLDSEYFWRLNLVIISLELYY